MDETLLKSVEIVTKDIPTPELVACYLAATAGRNPKSLTGYEKARGLFTENDGMRMHASTLKALDSIVERRLREEANG